MDAILATQIAVKLHNDLFASQRKVGGAFVLLTAAGLAFNQNDVCFSWSGEYARAIQDQRFISWIVNYFNFLGNDTGMPRYCELKPNKVVHSPGGDPNKKRKDHTRALKNCRTKVRKSVQELTELRVPFIAWILWPDSINSGEAYVFPEAEGRILVESTTWKECILDKYQPVSRPRFLAELQPQDLDVPRRRRRISQWPESRQLFPGDPNVEQETANDQDQLAQPVWNLAVDFAKPGSADWLLHLISSMPHTLPPTLLVNTGGVCKVSLPNVILVAHRRSEGEPIPAVSEIPVVVGPTVF